MRKLMARNDLPAPPAGFPFAVCDATAAAGNEVIAWCKTERDASLFAQAEEKMARLKAEADDLRQQNRSTSCRSYCRGLLNGQQMRPAHAEKY
jgi:hypothetical protein